jgi:hypothetical protein
MPHARDSPPPAAPPPEAPAAAPDQVTLAWTKDDLRAGPVRLEVAPGGSVSKAAKLRNQGRVVDSYALEVDGVPRGWWRIDPATVDLNPWGAREATGATIEVVVAPPRSSSAPAGEHTARLLATSSEQPRVVASLTFVIVVSPYTEVDATLPHPEQRGYRRARLALELVNRGNCRADCTIRLDDARGACRCDARCVAIQPGERRTVRVDVRARRLRWLGRPVPHRLLGTVSAGDDDRPLPFGATFTQRRLLPWLILPAFMLTGGVAAMLMASRPAARTIAVAPSNAVTPTSTPSPRPTTTATPTPAVVAALPLDALEAEDRADRERDAWAARHGSSLGGGDAQTTCTEGDGGLRWRCDATLAGGGRSCVLRIAVRSKTYGEAAARVLDDDDCVAIL